MEPATTPNKHPIGAVFSRYNQGKKTNMIGEVEIVAKAPKPNTIGEVEVASSGGPTRMELEEKEGNLDLTYQQKKRQIEAGKRDEAKITPEVKDWRSRTLKTFHEKVL